MTVAEYMNKFDELMLQCEMTEDAHITISRFRLGLRSEIKREMEQRVTDTLEQAFQAAVAIERYLRPQTNRRYESRSGEGRYDKVAKSGNVSKTPTSINNSMQGGPQNKDLKGKGVSVGTSKAVKINFVIGVTAKVTLLRNVRQGIWLSKRRKILREVTWRNTYHLRMRKLVRTSLRRGIV